MIHNNHSRLALLYVLLIGTAVLQVTIYIVLLQESAVNPYHQFVRILLWISFSFAVIALVLIIYLARKLHDQFHQVIEAANNITIDRLHERIPEHDARDEVGRIITTFNVMISRLEISFQQVKQFSADASHELRTPLSVMRTQLETALNAKASVGELRSIVANCLDETIRMTSIIDNLLLLARTDAGQDVVKREPVDLLKLVRETYEESVILASQKSITVSLQETHAATIIGDEQRIRQMLLNLIDNAIKYNHVNGNIDISLFRENGIGKIRIADSGIGIAESEIPRIFDRFYRVDKARSRTLGGSGLGLSIVKWIVQAHGGSIKVQSNINQGTEFIVSFPIKGN